MTKSMHYKFVAAGSQIYNSDSEWISEERLKDIIGALRVESSSTLERYYPKSGDFLYYANFFNDKHKYLGTYFAKMDSKTNKLLYKPERYDINNYIFYNM